MSLCASSPCNSSHSYAELAVFSKRWPKLASTHCTYNTEERPDWVGLNGLGKYRDGIHPLSYSPSRLYFVSASQYSMVTMNQCIFTTKSSVFYMILNLIIIIIVIIIRWRSLLRRTNCWHLPCFVYRYMHVRANIYLYTHQEIQITRQKETTRTN